MICLWGIFILYLLLIFFLGFVAFLLSKVVIKLKKKGVLCEKKDRKENLGRGEVKKLEYIEGLDKKEVKISDMVGILKVNLVVSTSRNTRLKFDLSKMVRTLAWESSIFYF